MDDYRSLARALHDLAPNAVVDRLMDVAADSGVVDLIAYLVDFEQTTLVPIPDTAVHRELPTGQAIPGTPAGRAFLDRTVVTEPREGATLVWTPILEGTDCTGVLAVTIEGALDAGGRRRCEDLGLLAGAAISIAARYSDLFNLVRRRKAMTLPASLQWDLLPPLRLQVAEATSSGMLEPAYEVGGDCFDHAVNGACLEVAVMDAMGHGLTASLLSALAIGTYRHDRRERQTFAVMHEHMNLAVRSEFDGEAFVTGVLARLHLASGQLSWINAGHPLPFLVRGGQVVRELECRPSLPWGLGGPLGEQQSEMLEPGDAVVFYTDGVVEGPSPTGEPFGSDRLVHFIESAAASHTPSDAILHQLIRHVVAYQNGELRDDATVLWLSWDPEHPAE